MKLVRVAGGASQRRAFEQQRAMAFLARYDRMAPDQRKSSDVVIEGLYLTPTGLAVALLTAVAKLPFVPIILAVTRHTGRRQLVAIEIAGVARIALDLRVRGSQWKFRRLVMIEANRAPLVLVVAGLAFGAVSSGVNILNPVAIDAYGANPFVAFANMARGAEDGAMCTLERELGLVMIERFDTLPCRLDVAIVTCLSKAPFVRIARLMTIEAASGRAAKFYCLRVTADAQHGFVSVAQFEIRKCVIECFAIELNDVGISPLMIGVTTGAFLLHCLRLTPMKSLTRLTIRGNFFVACKAETRLRFSRERFVAVAAVLLEFGVSVDNRTRDDKLFEQILRTRDRCRSACENHPDREHPHEAPAQWRASAQKKCAAKM
jgi:hypothetical protein